MTEKTKRLVMSTMGVLIAGFSVGILKRAENLEMSTVGRGIWQEN